MIARKIICFFLFFTNICILTAQEDDAYKKSLKKSSVAIFKAQKQMCYHKTNDAGGKLAKAVLIQSYAIKLYETKNEGAAICASNLARKYALEIINTLDNKIDNFFIITAAEKSLMVNCSNDADIYKQAKTILSSYPENDADYVDPVKLKSYKIDFTK